MKWSNWSDDTLLVAVLVNSSTMAGALRRTKSAKELHAQTQSRHLRNLIIGRLMHGEDGVMLVAIWKLTKMTLKMCFGDSPTYSGPARVQPGESQASSGGSLSSR